MHCGERASAQTQSGEQASAQTQSGEQASAQMIWAGSHHDHG